MGGIPSANRADLLLRSITDYAIYLLDRDSHVSSWNAGAERLQGYTPDQIIGEHFSVFYTQEDRAACLPDTVLARVLSEGRFEAEGWRVRNEHIIRHAAESGFSAPVSGEALARYDFIPNA